MTAMFFTYAKLKIYGCNGVAKSYFNESITLPQVNIASP